MDSSDTSPIMKSQDCSNRSFQPLSCDISGKSVVIDANNERPELQDTWPYNLTDYLKKFIGKHVCVSYFLPNGRFCERKGFLKVTGINFLGIQPYQTSNLLLIDLNSIKCVKIIGCNY